MRRLVVAIAISGIALVTPALANGSFLGSAVYSTLDGCEKWKSVDGDKVSDRFKRPEVLTERGFEGRDGVCTFITAIELEAGKRWMAGMDCSAGPSGDLEITVFEKLLNGSIKVADISVDREMVLVRCDVEKGK